MIFLYCFLMRLLKYQRLEVPTEMGTDAMIHADKIFWLKKLFTEKNEKQINIIIKSLASLLHSEQIN